MTAICQRCGQEWTRHPALEVECPVCGADVGLGCRRPSGHAGPFIEPHTEREQLAVDRKLLEMCPASARGEGPTAKRERNASQRALPGVTQPALLDTA